MEKTPNYKTKLSTLIDFKNYIPSKEKEELQKIKDQKMKNPDGVYDLPNNVNLKFNSVTKTMQNLSKDEITDKLKAAEEIEEKTDEKLKYLKRFNENNFGHIAMNSNNPNSPFSKNYGEVCNLEKIEVGSKILYKGSEYYVINNDMSSLDLSKTEDGPIDLRINSEQFNRLGCIPKNF